MKVSLKTFLPLTAGALLLTACNNKNARSIETESAAAQVVNKDKSLLQAEADSMVYRTIFNMTSAAKDSDKIKQFNELAGSLKSTYNEIDRILTEENIPDYNMKSFNLSADVDTSCVYQHFADSKLYRKFFQKIGIMNDSIKKQCDEADKRTRMY